MDEYEMVSSSSSSSMDEYEMVSSSSSSSSMD
jgi:hypothetical protein